MKTPTRRDPIWRRIERDQRAVYRRFRRELRWQMAAAERELRRKGAPVDRNRIEAAALLAMTAPRAVGGARR